MTTTTLAALAARLDCEVRFDEPLAPYTTYRIGGPAAAVVDPRSVSDVVEALRFAQEVGSRWLVLGLGSNVLIADSGFDGVVLRIGKGMDGVIRSGRGEPEMWTVGAGLPTPLLARRTARAGLGGVHRLVGVPGTLGGGVFMNAGAHGQDFSQVVESVDVVDSEGVVRTIRGTDIGWRYRSSGLGSQVVLAAAVRLHPEDPGVLAREIQRHFRWRKDGTPFDEACCGSVFRNPRGPGVAADRPGLESAESRSAGQLISACGLKGFRIGAARVSHKHANYIVNLGEATAGDVKAVIDAVRERVLEEFAVELALEVNVIE